MIHTAILISAVDWTQRMDEVAPSSRVTVGEFITPSSLVNVAPTDSPGIHPIYSNCLLTL